jgi:hypothetical protein
LLFWGREGELFPYPLCFKGLICSTGLVVKIRKSKIEFCEA